MKVSDFIYRFPKGTFTRRDGICRVRIFVGEKSKIVVLLTDLGEKNTSSSVTNSIKNICKSLTGRGLTPTDCSFIEHYEKELGADTFDLVAFDESGSPKWKPIQKDKVALLLECAETELNCRAIKQPYLLNEIDRLRNQIDPFIDSPWPEPIEITKRRNAIADNMIKKNQLMELIYLDANEQEIQRLLKQDLSIFAEIYANPKEEYICFSEYKISDGIIDFVVFSGRSRMDVTIIEIKGANFNLKNKGHYDKFSRKIEEAAHQIRGRLRYITDEYNIFKSDAHKIRRDVELGKMKHNALLGPHGRLEVDPNKDINIRAFIIGGRTQNDFEESRARHDYARSTHPSIEIESWDTWLRKLSRE